MDESVYITDHTAMLIVGILKVLEIKTYMGENLKPHFDPDMIRSIIEDINNKRM